MNEDYRLLEQIVNLSYLENLYQEHKDALDPDWNAFFNKINEASISVPESRHFSTKGNFGKKQEELMNYYRHKGHFHSSISPIQHAAQEVEKKTFDFQRLGIDLKDVEVKELEVAKKRYSHTIGFEYGLMRDQEASEAIQQAIESGYFEESLSKEEKFHLLEGLTQAEFFESFLHTKYVGKKRFSLEGGEPLVSMLSFFIDEAAKKGIQEIFIGMAHRGRMNILANILQCPLTAIMRDFEDDYIPEISEGMGDVRYHRGYDNDAVKTWSGKSIKLCMSSNPSHLESIDTVVEGKVKAKQNISADGSEQKIIPLLLHGDASLSGQGVIYELLQLHKLKGYETGGTIHIVVNNQIGFTALPEEGRSTFYCTDIAHTFGMPVFHVNAEDPENCVRIMRLALEIRQQFHLDVFIDFNCYRKHGHNEGDEPFFTQPYAYKQIRQKKTIRQLYKEKLLQEGIIDERKVDGLEITVKDTLQSAYQEIQEKTKNPIKKSKGIHPNHLVKSVETGVDLTVLENLIRKLGAFPDQFSIHPKLENLMKERTKEIHKNKVIDWSLAESLAFASLLIEGTSIRLSGQDSGRGTFSQRHAILVDQHHGKKHYPLRHLSDKQGRFEVWNSCLSEMGVLGFEYGYSTIAIKDLTIWEAQFGDFANGAQVIIDQYIASGEQKWKQLSNLVLFLPHGFEGQGPEHSSARLERFLSLSAQNNMQIVNPTTPVQLFHLLRRQIKQPMQIPLIVFTPKGLLRHPDCTSTLQEFTEGSFLTVIDDAHSSKTVKRLVLCSGRIYYDLDDYRKKNKYEDLAIIRIEQLYPLDEKTLKKLFAIYSEFKECLWVQEEPENMGGWNNISYPLRQLLPEKIDLVYVGRERSASPATGFTLRHKQEHEAILKQVFRNEG